jgi:hypothetical protein
LTDRLTPYKNKEKDNSIDNAREYGLNNMNCNHTLFACYQGLNKTEGQPGHQGHTLERYPDPDVVQNHVCDYCRECGSSLSTISSTMEGTRQVIDLPVIVPLITEHRIYSRECTCGHVNKADFPADVRSRISYGPRIQALYLTLTRLNAFLINGYVRCWKNVFSSN